MGKDKDKKARKPAPKAKGLDPDLVNGDGRLRKSIYEAELDGLALRLNDMARWLQQTGQRIVVVVEGRDTAGKGGVIGAIADAMNPRQCRVVALPKPTERESTQWYFQRYVPHLPAAGELVLFDRSWYNRAGVEKVMGFATDDQVKAFLRDAPRFEQLLVDDGVLLYKYWLTVDQAQQEERFAERAADPMKQWKLSPIDVKARERYSDYTRARTTMLKATDTPFAPWTLVDFNDQRLGRLTMIRDLLDRIPDHEVPNQVQQLPPLGHAPRRESFSAGLQPLPHYPVQASPEDERED